MYNFNELVDSLLLENPAATTAPATTAPATTAPATTAPAAATVTTTTSNTQWINELIKKYNELYSSKGDIVKEEDLAKLWPLVVKDYITDDEIISIGIERAKILDILKEIYNSFTGKKPNDFVDLVNNADAKKTTDIVNRLKAVKTPEDWSMKNGDVIRAYNIARSGADRASAVALETFNQSTIFNTVQEIVKRRTNAFDAISVLKSPTTPFKSLLQDIFKVPEQYLSGQKKITSDWSNIVDGLYVTTICNIALATKDLYRSLIKPPEEVPEPQVAPDGKLIIKTKKTPIDGDVVVVNKGKPNQKEYMYEKGKWVSYNETTKTWDTDVKRSASRAYQRQNVNASLNIFADLVNSVLLENEAVATSVQPQPVQAKDYSKDEAAYTNFYLNGTLPDDVAKSKDVNGKPVIYNIKTISELITPEAQKLIASLRNIAHYEKQKPGTGERMAGAQQALQGVASFAGAKLYT